MQFKALLGFAGLLAIFQAIAARSSTSLSKCGPSPKVLSTKKIPYKDNEAVITTYDCPSIVKRETILEAPAKRQIDVCGAACNIECLEFTNPTPLVDDCFNLGVTLEQNPDSFIAPSETITTATLGTCESWWMNESTNEYEYCITKGGIVSTIAGDCIPTSSGGQCYQPSDIWRVEVFG